MFKMNLPTVARCSGPTEWFHVSCHGEIFCERVLTNVLLMINVHPMSFDDTALDDATSGRSRAEPVKEPAAAPVADQTERQLALLASLAEMGHDIAIAMKNRAIYAAAEGKTDDKAVKGYALAAKTVQQVILLQREIKEHREKRRASLVSQRKARAKETVREAIERADPPGVAPQQQRTDKVRAVQRVQLDVMFRTLDDDLVERLSVAELVERACRLFGLAPDPTLRWPEWAELRGETPPEPAAATPVKPTEAQPTRSRPAIPARLAGASALGLNLRVSPDPPFAAGARERAPP